MLRKILWLLAVLLLAACSSSSGSAAVVEQYFTALAEKEVDRVVNLSCAAWEENARLDADTFSLYPVTAENIACQETARDGDTATVECTGTLALDYNGEIEEINLSDRAYLVVQEGGGWRMCGYK